MIEFSVVGFGCFYYGLVGFGSFDLAWFYWFFLFCLDKFGFVILFYWVWLSMVWLSLVNLDLVWLSLVCFGQVWFS